MSFRWWARSLLLYRNTVRAEPGGRQGLPDIPSAATLPSPRRSHAHPDAPRRSCRLLFRARLCPAAPPLPGPDCFASHRAALAAKLPPDAVVVLRAPSESEDLLDAYRPDSNFWYLTGFSEPDAIAVFRPGALEGKRYTLFVKPKSWAEEQWTGRRAGVEGAAEFRADAAYPMADFQKESRPLLAGAKALYYADARDKDFREKLVSAWQALAAAGPEALPALDVAPLLRQMRLLKDAGG